MNRLLIADDHLMVGSAMVYLLKQLDPEVEVHAVGSAGQAVEAVGRDGPFDLVLLDYDMPGTNGVSGMHMIREMHPDQTVGMISGRTEPHLIKEAMDAGAVGWLPKAMSDRPLLHALRMMSAGGRFVPTDVLEELNGADVRWAIFSAAEQRVAKLLAKALSDKEIARELTLEPKTVRNHVRAILRKAKVESRTKFALAFQDNR